MLICCSGMLRSGSGLQYNLVCSLLEKVGECTRHGRIDTEQEWLSQPSLVWAKDSTTYHVVKCAVLPQELQMAKDGLLKICYTHRDIRDVAVAAKERWDLTGDRLLEMLDRAVKGFYTLEEAGAFGMPWLLHQRYEEVFADTGGAVYEIARFLDVTASQEVVDQVVMECSLETLEAISMSNTRYINRKIRHSLIFIVNAFKRVLPPPLNGSWRLRKSLLRLFPKYDRRTLIAFAHVESTRGVPEAWHRLLEKKEQEAIAKQYEDYLMRAGYLV